MASFRVRANLKIDDGPFMRAQKKAPRTMAKALRVTSERALQEIKGKGPNAAPKRTGALRSSYKATRSHRGLRILLFSDTQVAHYARFVEFGTRKMSARPHFRPVIRRARRRLRSDAERVITKDFKNL